MMESPAYSLLLVAVMLVMGARFWRQNRVRRAVRNLSTASRRRLGPDPEYMPPENAGAADLRDFAVMHKRSLRIMQLIWGLAALWLAYVVYLMLGASAL